MKPHLIHSREKCTLKETLVFNVGTKLTYTMYFIWFPVLLYSLLQTTVLLFALQKEQKLLNLS